MAEPIDYDVKPSKTGLDAREELDRLLQSLHEHGVLRMANDLVCANTAIAKVLVDGLNKEGTLNVIQNLSILAMALSRVPPEDFYRVVFALKDAGAAISQWTAPDDKRAAPGVRGTYRLLQDESLWRAITPLLEGLKAMGEGMKRPVDKPISDFAGKPSDA
ncbi:hypothetical protein PflQ2_2352 [Pseudomonas fluorescens Q2-87]|uniref:DUF1641 domain-containing protein n=1 Tax=Pseudomonas fluorescens (strain Q2-87) TaxID=1038922 RepID=J2F618_PSEFQ|nr:DUF1641 domain-containing protein [Pseudomonas fluorescens]EJL04503.1 hypothetical protein PflQ2_2352 [Pseudomonas fluorescens Q2-87]